ncbi:TIGR02444 family protein [Marinobacter sp. M216]|uniref:TIGR02444 family protein n=1 Tax=Marinobacter albus TaxID=3030833 RepID=A0ABT7HEK9_9GAMM|nr:MULTISPECIES: TIGR02444 family protein [unclassified Marinobacter]MBW7472223.1 TIGR02444 family protein [Marinobacter sp. F4218]MDK9558793.1 TIGR02444 family protein [Marinobacter sp. M216]
MPVLPESHTEIPAEHLKIPEQLEPDSPLWRFALTFWQKAGVQEACLALQFQGWSVTRILCASWLALNGRTYTGSEDATVTEWRNHVTGALRTVRKLLPKASTDLNKLRQGVAGLELDAERIELALAWQTLMTNNPETGDMHGREHLIHANLEAAAPTTVDAGSVEPLLNTLAGALADVSKGEFQP